jgi:hypothetical protein
MGQRSRDELFRFLDYVRAKGLMSPNTVESRKASANKVLGILDLDEAEDVTKLDLDEVVHRFNNLHGQKYTPDSLRSYKSRTKSAIEDFSRYLENPMAFKPGVQRREKKAVNGSLQKKVHHLEAPDMSTASPVLGRPTLIPAASSNILPIPLRAELTVHVQGLPFDLTPAEAKKIAAVIQAMAMVE